MNSGVVLRSSALNPWVNKICDRDLSSHDVDVILVRDFPCTSDRPNGGVLPEYRAL